MKLRTEKATPQVISVDVFNTLIDLSVGGHVLWETFLGERATPTRVSQGWELTSRVLFAAIDQMNAAATYQSLHAVFKACYVEVFGQLQVIFDPERAARLLICHHARSPWFPDALPWLESVRHHRRVCLTTDTDEAMLGAHVRHYPFDMIFTSERLRTYKGDAQGRFFEALIRHYALSPSEILHVGDSPTEIDAAQRAGLQACWLNRNGRTWPYVHRPDHEVDSLTALASLSIGPRQIDTGSDNDK